MVCHHFLFDLCQFLGAPWVLFYNPPFEVLHYIFAAAFVLISGMSSRFSRSNLWRGAKLLVVALALELVTWFLRMPDRFGVLHLLSVSMLCYGAAERFPNVLPARAEPWIYLGLGALSFLATRLIKLPTDIFWMFGWYGDDFFSSDYFPIFPWIFVFFFGAWLGKLVVEGRFPKWFYSFKMPFFPLVGRHALLIYVLHQPVLYGIVMLLGQIIER